MRRQPVVVYLRLQLRRQLWSLTGVLALIRGWVHLPVYQQPNLVYLLVQLRFIRLFLWELWRITRLLAVLRSIQLPVCCQPVVLHVCVQLGLLLQRIAGLLALFWRRMHLSMHEQPDLVHVLLQQRVSPEFLQEEG